MAKNKVAANLENTLPSPSKQEDPVDNYEVKDHLRTLQEAHGIINDPEKMAKVHKLAGRHAKALAGIKAIPKAPDIKSTKDLVDYRNAKFGSAAGKHSLAALKNPPKEESGEVE